MTTPSPIVPTPATSLSLVAQIEGMLAYWRDMTAEVTPLTIINIDRERQNLLRAIQVGLLFPQTRPETAVILAQAFPFVEQRGHWREWIPLLERCLPKSVGWETASRVMLMARLGQAYRLNNQMAEAIAVHLEAEQLAQTTGEISLIGRTQHDLLEDYLFSRAYGKAKAIGRSAIETTKTDEETTQLAANCYKMLGTVYHQTGDSETALGYSRTAVQRWRQLNNILHLARALADLATPLKSLQKFEAAEASLREAADLLEPTIYELDKSLIQLNLGAMFAAQKRFQEAEQAFYKANSPYLRQSIHFQRKAMVNNNLGYVLFHQGNYEMAEVYLRQSVAIWEQVGDRLETANTMSTLADCLRARNQFQTALPLYDKVLDLLQEYPDNIRAERLLKQYLAVREQVQQQAKKQPAR